MKTAKTALRLLREIKSVTFSTLKENQPAARMIDVMFAEDDGLYFLTARGKPFYRQLEKKPAVAICGMNEKYVSVDRIKRNAVGAHGHIQR